MGKLKPPISAVSREAKFSRSFFQVLSSESRAVLGISVTAAVTQSSSLNSSWSLMVEFFPYFWPVVLVRSCCAF